MKVAELIDDLMQLNPEAELTFDIRGNTSVTEELDGRYYGRYTFDVSVEGEAHFDDLHEAGGVAVLRLEV